MSGVLDQKEVRVFILVDPCLVTVKHLFSYCLGWAFVPVWPRAELLEHCEQAEQGRDWAFCCVQPMLSGLVMVCCGLQQSRQHLFLKQQRPCTK